ncbi:MAG: AAA family ATPase [Candidatus Methanofishera endochildressiae]|uniref:AAA family ATPase n=1 Tax=Candidatus Methanofishera endochildressiae TaxID=2738884 RepID=A0A7Z0MNV1_9GAMM|nr:AAA family ATPase [Candidatus Methanofishera endochildressiae]
MNPATKINLIYGNNASGKSSILEAIHLRVRKLFALHVKKIIPFE